MHLPTLIKKLLPLLGILVHDHYTDLAQNLQKLVLAMDQSIHAPSFGGNLVAVEDWATQARLYIEDPGKTERQAVRHLASKFIGQARDVGYGHPARRERNRSR